jgi:hypothetical protein
MTMAGGFTAERSATSSDEVMSGQTVVLPDITPIAIVLVSWQ